MILIGGSLLLPQLPSSVHSQQRPATQDPTPAIRRIAATAQLAAQEYRDWRRRWTGGRSRRGGGGPPVSPGIPPLCRPSARPDPAPFPLREIDNLIHLVDRAAAPDSVDARVRRLATVAGDSSLASRWMSCRPRRRRSRAVRPVYQANCAGCHGDRGPGRRPHGSRAGTQARQPHRCRRAAGSVAPGLLPPDQHRRGRHGHAGVRGPVAARKTAGPRPSTPACSGCPRPRGEVPARASALRHHGPDVRRRICWPRSGEPIPTVRRRWRRLAAVRSLPAGRSGSSQRSGLRTGAGPARLGLRPGPDGRHARRAPGPSTPT